MCKHQFRDRQAHHSHSGINKLAVCRSQLDRQTQGQHMDALHFARTVEQTATEGRDIFLFSYSEPCLHNRWQNVCHKPWRPTWKKCSADLSLQRAAQTSWGGKIILACLRTLIWIPLLFYILSNFLIDVFPKKGAPGWLWPCMCGVFLCLSALFTHAM